MVDLKGQYKEIEQEIQKSLNEVLHSTKFIKGPDVSDLERDLEEVDVITDHLPDPNEEAEYW